MRGSRSILFVGWAAAVLTGVAAGGPPVLEEDFDDDTVGPLWSTFATDPGILIAAEQDMRLEFPADATGVAMAAPRAGLLADGWALDFTSDFDLRFDFHVDLPVVTLEPPVPMIHLQLVLAFETAGGEVVEGLAFTVGTFFYFLPDGTAGPPTFPDVFLELIRDGEFFSLMDVAGGTGPCCTGTVYVRYLAATDEWVISQEGFEPDNPSVFIGLAEFYGLPTQAVIRLQAQEYFEDGQTVSSYPGAGFYLDNVVLETGVIVPTCPSDTNGDGSVDVDDLNNVILDWGTDGSAHGGDVAGAAPGSGPDGIVDVNDLARVILDWATCD